MYHSIEHSVCDFSGCIGLDLVRVLRQRNVEPLNWNLIEAKILNSNNDNYNTSFGNYHKQKG